MTDVLTRDETPVMFTRARDEVDEIRRAWTELETTVGSLRGRKFFGAFDAATGEYRAVLNSGRTTILLLSGSTSARCPAGGTCANA